MKIKYYKELDGVRGIAALMIMIFHFSQELKPTTSFLLDIKKIGIFGQTGVSLFFVLSGFLITRILLSTKEKPRYFINFYLRRAVRIFPLYYAFLFLYYFVFNPVFFGINSLDFSSQSYYWFYLQNFAITFGWSQNGPFHFWSLAVEEHFYLFWPFLVYYLNIKRLVIATICVILVAFVTRIVLEYEHYEVFYFTFSRMDELAVGAILAVLEYQNKLIGKSKAFIYLFIGIMIPTVCLWLIFTARGNSMIQIIKFSLLSFSYFSFIGYVITIEKNNLVKRFLTFKPLLYTGKVSYGLYVFHSLGFLLFTKVFHNQTVLINFIGGFIFSYMLATVSFYSFEYQFLKLKKYFP